MEKGYKVFKREAGEQIEEAAAQAKVIRTELNQLLQEEVPR